MATQILSVADTAAASSDVTIAAGDSLTVSLKTLGGPIPVNALVTIGLKDDNSVYRPIEDRLTYSRPTLVLDAAGVYQFVRAPGASVGVFSG